jgi:hypothetical protein
MKLHEVSFLAKEREKFPTTNPIKFNGGLVEMKKDDIILIQKYHCQNLGIVSSEAVNLISSQGVTRKIVMLKG